MPTRFSSIFSEKNIVLVSFWQKGCNGQNNIKFTVHLLQNYLQAHFLHRNAAQRRRGQQPKADYSVPPPTNTPEPAEGIYWGTDPYPKIMPILWNCNSFTLASRVMVQYL